MENKNMENAMEVAKMFPDWMEVSPGEWSKHSIGNVAEKRYIGLYREPDESYTLQAFIGDNVVGCEEIFLREYSVACH